MALGAYFGWPPKTPLGAAQADATGNQWLPWPAILEGTSGPMWWASTFTVPAGLFSPVLMGDFPAYEPTSRLGSEGRMLHASTTAYHEVSEFSDQGPSPRQLEASSRESRSWVATVCEHPRCGRAQNLLRGGPLPGQVIIGRCCVSSLALSDRVTRPRHRRSRLGSSTPRQFRLADAGALDLPVRCGSR